MALSSSDLRNKLAIPYETYTPVALAVVTVTVADNGTNGETDVALNGVIKQIHFTVPDLDAADTAELLLHDADNKVLYASGEKAESTTHVINVERAVCGTITFRVECSASQEDAASNVFTVYVYYV